MFFGKIDDQVPAAGEPEVRAYRALWQTLYRYRHDPDGSEYLTAWYELHGLEYQFEFTPKQLRQARGNH